MKVIHWTPKENKDSILKNGIQIQDTRIACSILTPFDNLNRWWLDFSLLQTGKEYIGFIFELHTSDFPLVHAHWVVTTYQELECNIEPTIIRRLGLDEIKKDNPNVVSSTINDLKNKYRDSIIWRIGDTTNEDTDILGEDGIYIPNNDRILEIGHEIIKRDKEKAFQDFFDNPDFMEFVFEDYQVLLFNAISPERFETVIEVNDQYCYTALMEEIKSGI